MYNFKKLKDEDIILISDNSILKVDQEEKNISTILTNKRLLLFANPDSSNNYQEVLRTSRGMDYIKQKDIILELNLSDISKIIEEDQYDKYLLNDTNYFYLRDKDIKDKIISEDLIREE